MKKYFLFSLITFCIGATNVFAQINGLEQDCPYALPVCQTVYTENKSYSGSGLIKDLPDNQSCLNNEENNSVWYIFTVNQSGPLEMLISPILADDYDFAIYNITGKDCNAITRDSLLPIRCSYSAYIPNAVPARDPKTGLKAGFSNTTAGVADSNFLAPLNVVAGETYVLLIDNFNVGGGGYVLDFTTSLPNPANIVDVTPPVITEISGLTCDTTRTLTIKFSENIRCNTIDATGGQFTITGPSGVSVIGAASAVCASGAFTNELVITLNQPIVLGGNYTINTNPGAGGLILTDFCSNQIQNIPFQFVAPDIVFADFDYTIRASCAADTFYFADQSIGNPVSWSWNFGDGSPISTLENPVHVFPDTSQFLITYTATSADCSDTITKLVDVTISFKADFIISNINPCLGDTVFFSDNSPGTATNYLWDFGDGNIGGTQNAFNVYSSAGTFVVTLSISDVNTPGCLDTASGIVFVKPIPDATFLPDTDPICSGLPVRFTDATLGAIDSRLWDFGNGNTSTDSVGVFVFPSGGTYTVFHSVTDLFCGSDDTTLTFEVLERPQVNLGEDTAVCLSESVVLAGPAGAEAYKWSTGETTQIITFSAIPNEVALTVTANGCTNSDVIFVDEQDEDCFYVKVPSAFSPNGDGSNDFLKIFLQRIQSFNLRIFNRWGELVFETNNANLLWDGTYKDEPQDIGVFQYYIEGVSISGDRFFRSGTITLIR